MRVGAVAGWCFGRVRAPGVDNRGYRARLGAQRRGAITPDDRRFVMLRPGTGAAGEGDLVMVVNWPDELERRVPN